MFTLDDVRIFQNLSDEELRGIIYFMCGYRPRLMAEVAQTINQLKEEGVVNCASSMIQGEKNTSSAKTVNSGSPRTDQTANVSVTKSQKH